MNRVEQRRRQRDALKKVRRRRKLISLFFFLIMVSGLGIIIFLMRPQIELVGEAETELAVNQSFDDPGVKLRNKQNPLEPSKFVRKGKVDITHPGSYEITYTHTFWGLKSKVRRKVLVKPVEQFAEPMITLNGSNPTVLSIGSPYEEPGAQALDDRQHDLQDKLKISGNVDVNLPGTYEVLYEVTDSHGQSVQVKREVVVANGKIYLTFDDGPNDEVTPQFLQILREENIKGTFFVTGKGSDELLKQAYDEGHAIGLHTFSHDYANVYSSKEAYFKDLAQISDRVTRVTGAESKLIRFPGGSSNGISSNYSAGIMSALVNEVQEKGYQYFDWNVSSGDGSNQASAEIPYNNVVSNLKQGEDNIVLMHDTKQTSADALRKIIQFGKENGYAFEALTVESPAAHHGVNN